MKKAIDENIANKEEILDKTLNCCSEKQAYNRQNIRSRKLAFRAAVSFIIVIIILGISFFDILSIGSNGQSFQGKKVAKEGTPSKQLQKNTFTLVAFAAENSNGEQKIKEESKTILNSNMRIQMPFGKIERGEQYKTVISGIK